MGVRSLLDLICAEFPHPGEHRAPARDRIPRTKVEETRHVATTEPFSLQVFKTVADPYVGKLNYFRVYSGVLTPDSTVYNSRIGQGRANRADILFARKAADPATEVHARRDCARSPSLPRRAPGTRFATDPSLSPTIRSALPSRSTRWQSRRRPSPMKTNSAQRCTGWKRRIRALTLRHDPDDQRNAVDWHGRDADRSDGRPIEAFRRAGRDAHAARSLPGNDHEQSQGRGQA